MCASFRGPETKIRRADIIITINTNTTPSSEVDPPIIWFTDYSVQHSLDQFGSLHHLNPGCSASILPCRIESPSSLQPLNPQLKFPSSSMVIILDLMRKYRDTFRIFNVHFQDFRPQIYQGAPSFMKIILSTQHCSSSPSNSSG